MRLTLTDLDPIEIRATHNFNKLICRVAKNDFDYLIDRYAAYDYSLFLFKALDNMIRKRYVKSIALCYNDKIIIKRYANSSISYLNCTSEIRDSMDIDAREEFDLLIPINIISSDTKELYDNITQIINNERVYIIDSVLIDNNLIKWIEKSKDTLYKHPDIITKLICYSGIIYFNKFTHVFGDEIGYCRMMFSNILSSSIKNSFSKAYMPLFITIDRLMGCTAFENVIFIDDNKDILLSIQLSKRRIEMVMYEDYTLYNNLKDIEFNDDIDNKNNLIINIDKDKNIFRGGIEMSFGKEYMMTYKNYSFPDTIYSYSEPTFEFPYHIIKLLGMIIKGLYRFGLDKQLSLMILNWTIDETDDYYKNTKEKEKVYNLG